MLDYDGPILCNIKIETDKCLPLVAPGKGLDEMLLHEDHIKKKNFINQMPPN